MNFRSTVAGLPSKFAILFGSFEGSTKLPQRESEKRAADRLEFGRVSLHSPHTHLNQ